VSGVEGRASVAVALLWALAASGCDGRRAEELARIDEAPALPPPADELEMAIRRRAPNEALLMVPHDAPVRGELAQGQRRDFTAVLRPGLCYKVLGEGGAGVGDLDLVAYDPHGVLLQRDATQHPHPALGIDRPICPAEPGLYRFEIRMVQGGGPYAVQVWVSQ
jgi:hypothetical protein